MDQYVTKLPTAVLSVILCELLNKNAKLTFLTLYPSGYNMSLQLILDGWRDSIG
jgi:hypothetical protein